MSSTYASESGWLSASQHAPDYHPILKKTLEYGTINCGHFAELKLPYNNTPRFEQQYHDISHLQNPHNTTEHASVSSDSVEAPFGEDSTSTSSLWKEEIKTIVFSAAPMMVSMILQTSISVSSIFVVGRMGPRELGAVSLANMTAIITGYVCYQGFAMSLDTLCPQAFGSGRYQLVGLHMQRMTAFLVLLTIPIAAIWFNAAKIITSIVPDEHSETATLAGTYLRILLIGAPGFACFETGKKFVQAQGHFLATLSVLLVCAPLNAVMSWAFVWVSLQAPESVFSSHHVSRNLDGASMVLPLQSLSPTTFYQFSWLSTFVLFQDMSAGILSAAKYFRIGNP